MFLLKGGRGFSTPLISWNTPFFPGVYTHQRQYIHIPSMKCTLHRLRPIPPSFNPRGNTAYVYIVLTAVHRSSKWTVDTQNYRKNPLFQVPFLRIPPKGGQSINTSIDREIYFDVIFGCLYCHYRYSVCRYL